MTDISALLALDTTDPATALAFRRGVAELAGWYLITEHITWNPDSQWLAIYPHGRYIWRLISPDGSDKNAAGTDSPDEEHIAWNRVLEDGLIPPYESSLDAALTLVDGLFWNLYGTPPFALADNPFRCEIARSALGFHSKMELYEDAPTPALAVCRAFLRYRSAQSAPVATADYRQVRGALKGVADDEPAEDSISRLRDEEA